MGVCTVSRVRAVSGAQAIWVAQTTTTKTVARPLLTPALHSSHGDALGQRLGPNLDSNALEKRHPRHTMPSGADRRDPWPSLAPRHTLARRCVVVRRSARVKI